VLATNNEIIPYGIGLDIGCRMALSIFSEPAEYLKRHSYQLKVALQDNTHFGIGKLQDGIEEHAVLDRDEFREIELLKQYHGKAKGQIGTSGSGNHFAEFGKVVLEAENKFGLDAGEYVGLLTHSGSRGLGAAIANYYMRVAIDTCWLPQGAKHLAWLDMDSEAGMEYW
jgi:tRNA-splicing ligase RtcB